MTAPIEVTDARVFGIAKPAMLTNVTPLLGGVATVQARRYPMLARVPFRVS